MDMEVALRARLIAAAPVAAIVANYTPQGGTVTKAIFWVTRPQTSGLPAITLQHVTDERAQSYTGFDGAQPAYVQIDVWAAKYEQGKALKDAVIAALTPRSTNNGIRFDRAFVSARDLSERTDTQFIFRPSMDFTFYYATA